MVSSDPEGAIQALRKLLNGLWVMLEVLEWSPVTQAGGAYRLSGSCSITMVSE